MSISEPDTRLKTRFRLIDIAAKHMARVGYEGMSLRKVADEADITAAAVYRHFPDGKSGLYEATLGMVAEQLADMMQTLDSSTDVATLLINQCDQLWQFFEANPNIAAMIVRENITGGRDGQSPSPYIEQHIEHIGLTRAFLEDAINKGDLPDINISTFLFWVSSYIANFHGCRALRDAVFDEKDLAQARDNFLNQVRQQIIVRK